MTDKPRVRVRAHGVPDQAPHKVRDSFQNLAARIGVGTGNLNDGGSYALNPISRNRVMLEWAYRGSWIVRNAVDAIPDDMVREGIDILSTDNPKAIAVLNQGFKRFNIWKHLAETMRWARLYGGAICVIMIEGQKLDGPLRLDTIGKGQFKGLMVLDRWLVQPSLENLVEEYGTHFGKPKFYNIVADFSPLPRGKIHYSRIIRFEGEDVPFWQRIAENGWGVSVLEPLWDRLVAFDSITNGVGQLIHKAHLRILKMKDLRENIASGSQRKIEGIAKMIESIRLYQTIEGLTLIDAEDEFETQNYTFAGLAEVLDKFSAQLSGATKIPIVRLFGQSPGGLNATGDSDIRNYYDAIHEQQEHDLRGPVALILDVLYRSELGDKPARDLEFEFSPLWQLSEIEKGELNTAISNSINQTFEAGYISQKTALTELKQSSRITGVWTNITDQDIQGADDQPPIEAQKEAQKAAEAMGLAGAGEPPQPGEGAAPTGGAKIGAGDDGEHGDKPPAKPLGHSLPKFEVNGGSAHMGPKNLLKLKSLHGEHVTGREDKAS